MNMDDGRESEAGGEPACCSLCDQPSSPRQQRLLLLTCMHRCCVRCADAAANGPTVSAGDADDVGEGQRPIATTSSSVSAAVVVCPLCHEETIANERLCDALADVRTVFPHRQPFQPLLPLEHRGQATIAAPCQFCDEKNTPAAAATLWCINCRKYLCFACDEHHRRFLPEHRELPLAAEEFAEDATELQRTQPPQWLACPLLHHGGGATWTELKGDRPAAIASLLEAKAGPPADHACADCRRLCCTACAATCADAGHAVRSAAALGESYVADVRRRIGDLALKLESGGEAAARAGTGLLPALGRARATAVGALLANKRRLLKMIDEAFDEVKAKVEDSHATLAEHAAADLVPEAMRLSAMAERAASYARGILGSSGGGGEGCGADNGSRECRPSLLQSPLLLQHGLLLSRLELLTDRLRRFDVPPADADGRVAAFSVESEPPGEQAYHALTRWLGAPAIHPDIVGRVLWSSICRSALYGRDADQAATGRLGNGEGASVGGASGLRELLSPPNSCFSLPFDCLDIALNTAGDRVLVAAGKRGLIEYNLDGGELSRWELATRPPLPASTESVCIGTAAAVAEHSFLPPNLTHDFNLDLDDVLQSSHDSQLMAGVVGIGGVLSDESAVVCVDGCSCVVLARHKNSRSDRRLTGSWYEARRLEAFEGIRFFSLSVNGGLVAAAEGFAPWPVPRVPAAARGGETACRVASVYSGCLQSRQNVGSEISLIHAVAVVPDVVVVSGGDARCHDHLSTVEAADCPSLDGRNSATVVAAFRMASSAGSGGSGACLWRVDRRYQGVRDIRAAYRGSVVYLLATTAGADSPSVLAVDGRFGNCLADLTVPDLLRMSYRLSAALASSADQMLAFLHFTHNRIYAARAPTVRPPRW